MKTKKLTLRRVILALLAGVVLWASFSPLSLWFLAVVGIALFVRTLRDASLPSSFFYGLGVGLGLFLPLFYWARIASGSVLAWIALAFSQALFIGLVGFAWQLLARSPRLGDVWLFPLSTAIVWVAVEQLRAMFPFGGLPWGLLGFGQVKSPFVHLAPYGSTQLVGGCGVLTGVFLSQIFRPSVRLSLRYLSATIVCAVPFATSLIPLAQFSVADTVNVAYAQGVVPRSTEEVSGSRALVVTENLRSEVVKLQGKNFDFLVLPESTSDRDIRVDRASGAIIEEMAQVIDGRPILLGTQEYIDDYRFNDYILFRQSHVQARYSKQHPVPFGEYLPFRSFFVPLVDAASQISMDMRAGNKPALLDVPLGQTGDGLSEVRIATPICFEVGDSQVLSDAVRRGASLIVVPTNNASFGDTAESRQQFDMTRFRAVEYGRDAIQISTVGISGAIAADGSIIEKTEQWESASGVVSLSVYDGVTWTARFYSHIVILVFVLGAGLTAVALLGQVTVAMRRSAGEKP
ncbi:MAG: apolipoprotein N-acyltransferase [Actinomycetaceae bacterium]|nr:apolipoprotein N-acyltransferase [Actinomycetaceae bacterium]